MKDIQGTMDVKLTEDLCVTDNYHLTTADDKCMDAIDLSNACREFYHERKRAAEMVKEKLANSGRQRTTKKTTSIDTAMETLRTEMASLMDQDLSLMKQLLTLNETIEDLKWQRGYNHSHASLPTSSCDLSDSDWSISNAEMEESENEATQNFDISPQLSITGLTKESEFQDKTETMGDKSKKPMYACQSIDTAMITEGFQRFLTETSCHTMNSGMHDAHVRQQIPV